MDGISRLTYKQKGPKYFGPFCVFYDPYLLCRDQGFKS